MPFFMVTMHQNVWISIMKTGQCRACWLGALSMQLESCFARVTLSLLPPSMSSASASPRAGRDHGVGFHGNIFFVGHFHNPFVGSTLSCCSMVGLEIKTFQTSKESKARQLGPCLLHDGAETSKEGGTRKKHKGQRSCLMFCSCRFRQSSRAHAAQLPFSRTAAQPCSHSLWHNSLRSHVAKISSVDSLWLWFWLHKFWRGWSLSEIFPHFIGSLKSFRDTFLASPLQQEAAELQAAPKNPPPCLKGKCCEPPIHLLV